MVSTQCSSVVVTRDGIERYLRYFDDLADEFQDETSFSPSIRCRPKSDYSRELSITDPCQVHTKTCLHLNQVRVVFALPGFSI